MIRSRNGRQAWVVGVAVAVAMLATPIAAQEQQKPNILVIWGDDAIEAKLKGALGN